MQRLRAQPAYPPLSVDPALARPRTHEPGPTRPRGGGAFRSLASAARFLRRSVSYLSRVAHPCTRQAHARRIVVSDTIRGRGAGLSRSEAVQLRQEEGIRPQVRPDA